MTSKPRRIQNRVVCIPLYSHIYTDIYIILIRGDLCDQHFQLPVTPICPCPQLKYDTYSNTTTTTCRVGQQQHGYIRRSAVIQPGNTERAQDGPMLPLGWWIWVHPLKEPAVKEGRALRRMQTPNWETATHVGLGAEWELDPREEEEEELRTSSGLRRAAVSVCWPC